MPKQLTYLSPHQNGKVFGILMALASLTFVIPFSLFFLVIHHLTAPIGLPPGPPPFLFLIFPVMYMVFGYLSVALGCLLYNFMFKYIGGIEFQDGERPRDPAS